jgi:protein-disulfide isomerase/uncharacterized membrane protein
MDALKDYGVLGLAALVALAGFVVGDDYQLMCFLIGGVLACAGLILRSARTGIAATAWLCFGCSAYLFSRKLASADTPSLCNVNDVINCDVVNSSAASELFGVPITLFGMGFYLGLGLAALTKQATTPRLFAVNTVFAVLNVLYSLYLAYESAQIGAVCLMCITMYAGNGLLLWAGIKGLAEQGRSLGEEIAPAATSTTMVTLVGTFAIVLLVGMSSWSSRTAGNQIARPDPTPSGQGGAQTPSLPAGILFQPRGEIRLSGTEPVYGDPQAPYTVLEFADYGCPHCAMAAVEIKQLVKEFPEVQVRFRPFPLTAACNPALQADRGPERCHAAMATKCAQRQGKFWELSNLVFANQNNLGDADLAFMADQVGLDMAQFEQCMADPSIVASVQADAMAGAQAGLMGTPAFYLKGTHGDQWLEVQSVPNIAKAVSAHLAGATMPPPSPPQQHLDH